MEKKNVNLYVYIKKKIYIYIYIYISGKWWQMAFVSSVVKAMRIVFMPRDIVNQ